MTPSSADGVGRIKLLTVLFRTPLSGLQTVHAECVDRSLSLPPNTPIAMPSHRLLTLGVPQLLPQAGEQVRFRTRKHLALLIRLALEPGKRLRRESLMALLWPEAPTRLAR